MEITEIIAALEHHTGQFPREAVAEAIAHQDKITPHSLIQGL